MLFFLVGRLALQSINGANGQNSEIRNCCTSNPKQPFWLFSKMKESLKYQIWSCRAQVDKRKPTFFGSWTERKKWFESLEKRVSGDGTEINILKINEFTLFWHEFHYFIWISSKTSFIGFNILFINLPLYFSLAQDNMSHAVRMRLHSIVRSLRNHWMYMQLRVSNSFVVSLK